MPILFAEALIFHCHHNVAPQGITFFVVLSEYNSSETHLEPSQTSKMEFFAKIVNGWKLLNNFAKSSILVVSQGFEYAANMLLNQWHIYSYYYTVSDSNSISVSCLISSRLVVMLDLIHFVLKFSFILIPAGFFRLPANIYLFKVNNRNTRRRYEICSKLTIKTLELHHWRCSSVFIVNF